MAKTSVGAGTIVVISQVYKPDSASVGQYLGDAAEGLAGQGYSVITLTADRGYDDPAVRYAAREKLNGVEVARLPWSSFGKLTLVHRLLGQLSFLAQAIVHGLLMPRIDAIIFSTSPPMGALAALLIRKSRHCRLVWWVMDINPDQAVALKRFQHGSYAVRVFDALNRAILRRVDAVITLDRFMEARLNAKINRSLPMEVFPPWPHLNPVGHDGRPHSANPFRLREGLGDQFVFMYSGNHSLAHPLDTLLEEIREPLDEDSLFLFVGGGVAKRPIDEWVRTEEPPHVRCLPYQPLETLDESLSAADVHIVSMGDAMRGIVHPCKVYGAMAVGRPILYLGRSDTHVGDIVKRYGIGWQVEHGDVAGMRETLRAIRATPREELAAMGERAREAVVNDFNPERLKARFAAVVESAMGNDETVSLETGR